MSNDLSPSSKHKVDIISMVREKFKDFLINPFDLEPYLKSFDENEYNLDLVDKDKWKERRVFITGISGFVGSYLAEKLLDMDCYVAGLVRRHALPVIKNIRPILGKVKLYEGNLIDFSSLLAVKDWEPDVIFHMAAQSFVPTSFRCPIETLETNVIGTANLLEVIRIMDVEIEAILMASSSEQYGKVKIDEIPISEECPMRPQSPYAVSKVACEYLFKNYFNAYGIPVRITRAFNHTGPRRGPQFVTSVICSQVAKALLTGDNRIVLGNLNPIRDFTDVRDMIQGYLLAIDKGESGEVYNLGHGYGISIRDLVYLAAKVVGINCEKIKISIDKTRFRPAEVDVLICDYSKAKRKLGYRPRFPLTKAIEDNVEYFIKNKELRDQTF